MAPTKVLMEALSDILISFHVLSPMNKKKFKRKHGHTSQFKWERIEVVNYPPTTEEAALLPPPLLTECHAAWLYTLDFLKPVVNLIPADRITCRSLSHLSYSNMLPTWSSRPFLLAGNSASTFLASLIKARCPETEVSLHHS